MGQYPLPQTMLVVLVELIKLVATIVRAGSHRPSPFKVRSCHKGHKGHKGHIM